MTPQEAYEAHRKAYREANGLPTAKARGRVNYGKWLRSDPQTKPLPSPPEQMK